MIATLQKWIAVHGALPGLMACGVRPPAGKCTCYCLDELGPPQMMEQLLQQFQSVKATLIRQADKPFSSTWIFDRGHIRFVARPDNWVFVIVVEADSEALAKLDALADPFLSATA